MGDRIRRAAETRGALVALEATSSSPEKDETDCLDLAMAVFLVLNTEVIPERMARRTTKKRSIAKDITIA